MPRDRRPSRWFRRFRPRRDRPAAPPPADTTRSSPPDAPPARDSSIWEKIRQRAEDDIQVLSPLGSKAGKDTRDAREPEPENRPIVTVVEETGDPERKSAETWIDRVRPKQLEDRLLEQYRQFQQQRQTPPDPADLNDATPDERSPNPFERVWANLPNLPDRADIERRFEKLARNAKPEDIGKIIKRLPEMNRGPIRELWPKVRSLFEMIRDPQAAWSAKALAIGALIYLISPFDAIPDFIPFAGLADDAALIVAVVAALARELDRYVRQSMEASVETAEKLAEIEVRKYNRIVRITLLGSIATALITIGLKLWLDSD